MTEEHGYLVGEVAPLSGVTIRTLHYYDRIDLLRPSGRLYNGYRRYEPADIERLQQILVYRELGFRLAEIRALLEEQEGERITHLRRQHQLLRASIERQHQMLAALEKEMEADQMDISLTPEERFELWGNFNPTEYAEEVEERWGYTDAYKESQRRVRSYTKDDWARVKEEGAQIETALAQMLRSEAAPDDEDTLELVERHRQHISRWFYECSVEMHQGLGHMYVDDHRFTAYYENIEPGLAAFVHDAIEANAQLRRGGRSEPGG